MSQLFSTELLPVSDRVDAWQWNARQVCGDCQIRLPRSSFHGTIDIRSLGGLRFTRFASSPLAFSKWPCDVSTPDNRFCIVITQLAGVRTYVQNGISVSLSAGDSTLIDSSSPWSSTCSTDCSRLYFRVPRWMMEHRLHRSDLPLAQKMKGSLRTGAVLSRLSQSLYEEAGRLTEEEEIAALDAYFDALSACISGSDAAAPAIDLRQQIRAYIHGHLSEPTLGPRDIASAMGISVRHLHRLFLATGSSLGDYVRNRRLEGCRRDLANPYMRARSITEIAFFWGFSDSAHFSHVFKKQFGVSPRGFRGQYLRGPAAEPEAFANSSIDEILPSDLANPN